MTEEQKFHLNSKLCHEILAGVAEGDIPLDQDQASDILFDALSILASKEIKMRVTGSNLLNGQSGAAGEEPEELVDSVQTQKLVEAKGKILSKVKKKKKF